MLKRLKSFVQNEEGAVTVDWVVLSAAVVLLAAIAYNGINGPTGNVANGVSTYLTDYEVK